MVLGAGAPLLADGHPRQDFALTGHTVSQDGVAALTCARRR